MVALELHQYRAMLYRLTLDSIDEWDESEHPRDDGGRFTAGVRDWRRARDAALEKIRQDYKKPVEVPSGDGDPIIVSYAGLKHALNKGIPTVEKTLLALHIQEAIKSASKTRTFPDRLGRKDPASTTYYETKVEIDGEPHDVTIVVRNHSDGKRHYDHATVKGKAHQGYFESDQGFRTGAPTRPFGGLSLSLGEIDEMLKMS